MSFLLNPFISFPAEEEEPEEPGGDEIAIANFVAGTYSVGVTTLAAADVVDHPEYITVNGLVIPGSSGIVLFLGDFLSLLLTADYTILLEWEELSSSGRTILFYVDNNGTFDDGIYFERVNSGLKLDGSDYSGSSRFVEDPGSFGVGIHKLAFTRVDARLSMSVDGNTVQTDTSSTFSIAPNVASTGGYVDDPTSYNATRIRSIKVYSAVADVDLPALSA